MVCRVRSQQMAEMPLAEHDNVVKTFPPDRTDRPFAISVLPRRSRRGWPIPAAIEALLLVAEHGGPTMFARIGFMRTLNRHVKRLFNPDRKEHRWGRRKLARDRVRISKATIFRRR